MAKQISGTVALENTAELEGVKVYAIHRASGELLDSTLSLADGSYVLQWASTPDPSGNSPYALGLPDETVYAVMLGDRVLPNSMSEAVLATSPEAYYTFSNVGDLTEDSSGNGNSSVIIPTMSQGTYSLSRSASPTHISGDGSIGIPNTERNTLTVSTLFTRYTASVHGSRYTDLISFTDTNDPAKVCKVRYFEYYGGRSLQVTLARNLGADDVIVSVQLEDYAMNHVVLVLENRRIRMYVDGMLRIFLPHDTDLGVLYGIDVSVGGNTSDLIARYSDVAKWDRVLDPTEIRALYDTAMEYNYTLTLQSRILDAIIPEDV